MTDIIPTHIYAEKRVVTALQAIAEAKIETMINLFGVQIIESKMFPYKDSKGRTITGMMTDGKEISLIIYEGGVDEAMDDGKVIQL